MYLAPLKDQDPLVLRVDTGGGPVAGTELTLRREAEVYMALEGKPVLIPRFHGLHPAGGAFLMDRAAGQHELSLLDDAGRVAICDRFMEALADVHLIDASTLDLPSFRRPKGPGDHAKLELDLWGSILEDKLSGDLALGRCALEILRQRAPAYDGPTVLCHGDVGPKNFMFDKGRITAIIDWENAHLGDPMDDLAWWIFRGHEWLGAAGSLADQLQLWSSRSGIPLDEERLVYYRTFVLLRWYIEIRTGMANGGSSQDRVPYLRLIPALDVKLARALAQLLGVDLGPLPTLDAEAQPLATNAIAALHTDLVEHIIPALEEPEARRRANSALEYLSHLEAVDRFGGSIRSQDRAELLELVGRTGAPEDALLAEAVSGDVGRQEALLRYVMRRGARHAHLWPSTIDRALAPPWKVASLGLASSKTNGSPS
jgi:aminoglycoside phosphotransferase (APT) family kinase protein